MLLFIKGLARLVRVEGDKLRCYEAVKATVSIHML
jgi:hypothetical protein